MADDTSSEIYKILLTDEHHDFSTYKSSIKDVSPYVPIGYDTPTSLYDSSLLKDGRGKISMLFGGIGDARHLIASLISIGADERAGKIASGTQFHFTIVDKKPAVVARNVILLLLLFDLASSMVRHDVNRQEKIAATIYYMYLSPIMPPEPHRMVQRKIQHTIYLIERGEPFPWLLSIPNVFLLDVETTLHEWHEEALEKFPTSKLRYNVVKSLQGFQRSVHAQQVEGQSSMQESSKQAQFYYRTGVLLRSTDASCSSSSIRTVYQKFDVARPHSLDVEAMKIVDTLWKTNVTMIDLHWEDLGRQSTNRRYLDHDPFAFGRVVLQQRLTDLEDGGLFDVVRALFTSAAETLVSLKKQIKIEACVADVNDLLRQLRFGLGRERPRDDPSGELTVESSNHVLEQPNDISIADFPVKYDRIHLGNTPDRSGGSLMAFTCALPLINAGDSRYITFASMRKAFPVEHNDYNTEYTALSATSDLRKIFGARMMAPIVSTQSTARVYARWAPDPLPKQSSDLMALDTFELWLKRLFLKIVIPKEQFHVDGSYISSPLNLTAFLHLCGYLHDVGYSAQSFNSVLNEICSGTITTTARPPRSIPLKSDEAATEFPSLAQSTQPFVAEMITLLGIWKSALPFEITAPAPPKDRIREYCHRFSHVEEHRAEPACFILVLYSVRHMDMNMTSFRSMLLSDETGYTYPRAKRLRENMHVITNWNCDWPNLMIPGGCVTFWMDKDIMDPILESQEWVIQIWRTDDWTEQSYPEPFVDVRDEGSFAQFIRLGGKHPLPDFHMPGDDDWESD